MTEAGLRGSLALTDINVGPPTSCTCRARALPGSRVAFQACSSSGGMPWACAAAHQTASTHTAIQTNHCRLPWSETDRDCSNIRSEKHTSELQSLMRTSYSVFCLKQKKT